MWPRLMEMGIGAWLIASAWLLPQNADTRAFQINDWICGSAIIALAGLSFWPALRRAHLIEIGVGLWMLGFAYFTSPSPAPPAVQSEILAALFLLNFAIIPSKALDPPQAWRDFRMSEPAR